MKQTGQLKIIKNGVSVNFANKVTFIFTKKDGSKITRDTTATGSWDFDVPNDDYFISAFVTDSTEKKTEQFRGGLIFAVNAQTKVTALNDWIGTGSVDAKDPNRDWWENLLKETQKSSSEAKQARDEIKNNSIGDANGKWMKEGAYGLAGRNSKNTPDFNIRDLKNYPRGFSWLYCLNNVTGKPAGNGSLLMNNYADDWASYLYFRDNGWLYHGSRLRGVDSEWAMVYSESTARKDKNNVLHATTGAIKDTLLVGDYGLGGNVVQVTSGNPWEQHGKKSQLIMNNASNLIEKYSYGIYLTPMNVGFHSVLSWGYSNASNIKLFIKNNVKEETVSIWNTGNTTVDSNGVIFSGTKTPINTLNVSDMVQNIVDRDDVTVTSGAVKRGLDKKWDIQKTIGNGDILREKIDYSSGKVGFWDLEDPDYLYGLTISTGSLGHNLKILTNHKRHVGVKFVRNWDGNQDWGFFYTNENTTVDSNGFIKSASPIIRLFDDHIETNNQFKDSPVFEKLSTGVYKISNTLGLSSDGWTYEKPRGGDGNPYFRIVVKKIIDGCIISVHDEYDSIEEAEIIDSKGNKRLINKVVKILSEARDIKPHERWIDLRFNDYPQDEILNDD